jgi:hypothetical protein
MFEAPKNLLDLNPNVPVPLGNTIKMCINVDPRERLPAHELWARLRSIQATIEAQ